MRTVKTLLAAIALVLLPLNAHANMTSNWTGDCDGIIIPRPGGGSTGCTGQAAMLVVTTDAYILGRCSFQPSSCRCSSTLFTLMTTSPTTMRPTLTGTAKEIYEATIHYEDTGGLLHESITRMGKGGIRLLRHS